MIMVSDIPLSDQDDDFDHGDHGDRDRDGSDCSEFPLCD